MNQSIVTKGTEEAYAAGRKEATDELQLENDKLRGMIEALHSEVGQKQKLIAEGAFKISDLERRLGRA